MISRPAFSVRKLLRTVALAVIGGVAASLAGLNLIANDEQSRYFAAAELLVAFIMLAALVHEIRIGGWRSGDR